MFFINLVYCKLSQVLYLLLALRLNYSCNFVMVAATGRSRPFCLIKSLNTCHRLKVFKDNYVSTQVSIRRRTLFNGSSRNGERRSDLVEINDITPDDTTVVYFRCFDFITDPWLWSWVPEPLMQFENPWHNLDPILSQETSWNHKPQLWGTNGLQELNIILAISGQNSCEDQQLRECTWVGVSVSRLFLRSLPVEQLRIFPVLRIYEQPPN